MVTEELIWAPQPRQIDLLTCPVEDVLFGGSRGGGKTDGLLGDWATHAEDYGAHARGIFFRKSYPELEEVERRCHEIFPGFGAQWQATKRTWIWPNGASVRLRFLERDIDADSFQGHAYTWVGFDELGNWATSIGVDKLRACLRSAHGVPCYFRASANPGGVGHNWVKGRYIDPSPPFTPFVAVETIAGITIRTQRCFIPATLDDNPILLHHDPGYWQRVVAGAGGNEALAKAWRYGDWDIVAGGLLDDVWNAQWHVLEPFDIPRQWRIRRAFDWGSSKPFSVGWWAHSDGATPVGPADRVYPKGTRVRLMEYYGWNGKPNEGVRMTNTEIARRIKEIEDASSYKGRIEAGPADSQIFDVVNGTSIAQQMASYGVSWHPAQKGPGSRRQGWQVLRQLLKASTQWPMEEAGLFVFNTCRQFLRTVPVLPRDKADADDADSDAEDHCLHGATLVETVDGTIPIAELVGKRGFVCTDAGPRPFTSCRLTRKHAPLVCVTFANGRQVSCTPDHRFMTMDGRWVEAQDLTDEICYHLSSAQEDRCVSQLSVPPSKSLTANVFISVARTSSIKGAACIRLCGSIIMAPFRQVLKSIIAPMTAAEIKLRIWNYCQGVAIANTMLRSNRWANRASACLPVHKQQLSYGMGLQKDMCGIENSMSSIAGLPLPTLKSCDAHSAGRLLWASTVGNTIPSVGMLANLLFDVRAVLMTKIACVVSAIRHFVSIAISAKQPVAQHAEGLSVVSVQPAEHADVYCLTVPHGHRFAIEGGIIVHNCGDECRYECTMPLVGRVGTMPLSF